MCGIAGFIPMPGVIRESALEAVGRMTARWKRASPTRKEHGRVKASSWAWARTVIEE